MTQQRQKMLPPRHFFPGQGLLNPLDMVFEGSWILATETAAAANDIGSS